VLNEKKKLNEWTTYNYMFVCMYVYVWF
jgi:hypothetical protein